MIITILQYGEFWSKPKKATLLKLGFISPDLRSRNASAFPLGGCSLGEEWILNPAREEKADSVTSPANS